MHHMHGIFRHLRHHLPGEMRHRGKHRHGRGFGHVFADMGEHGFDRAGFRTGRAWMMGPRSRSMPPMASS